MPSNIIASIAKEMGSSGTATAVLNGVDKIAACTSAAAAVSVLGSVAAAAALPLLVLTGGAILDWHRDKRRDTEMKDHFQKLHTQIERLRQAQQSQADLSGLMDELFRQAHARGGTIPQSAADVDALMSSLRTEIASSDAALLRSIDASFDHVRIYLSKISNQIDRMEARQQKQSTTLDEHTSALGKLLAIAQTDDTARRAQIERELRPKLEAEIEAKLIAQFGNAGTSSGKPIDEQARELAADVIARLHDPVFVQRIRDVGGEEAVLEHFEEKAFDEVRAAEAHMREAEAQKRAAEAHVEAVVQASLRAADWAVVFGNTARAAASLDNALRLRPHDPALLIMRGRVAITLGDLSHAESLAQRALPASAGDERLRSVALDDLGRIRQAQGDLSGALAAYEAGLKIAEGLSRQDPRNAGWQRDLSVSHNKIGDVRRAQGDLSGALAAYEADLKIAEGLSRQDPRNAEWQQDLSISHDRIGNVRAAQGDLSGALAAYEAGLKIREELSRQDPENAGWQRGLWVSRNKIGEVREAQGDLSGALAAYEAGLKIAEGLSRQDPRNAEWQRDLSISHEKIGNVRAEQGDLSGALAAYDEGLKIAEALSRQDPRNAEWQRDLAVSCFNLGLISSQRDDKETAKTYFNRGRSIAVALVKLDPTNATWRDDHAWVEAQLRALGD